MDEFQSYLYLFIFPFNLINLHQKLKLPIIILIVVCPFFSNYITQTYNQRVDHEQRILMYNPKVNDYVKFKTLKVQNNFITGILVYKGKIIISFIITIIRQTLPPSNITLVV